MRELSYDRTSAGEFVQHLQDEGLSPVQFGQGFFSIAAPTAELERLSVSRALWHGGHPVLRWNASNVAVRHDPAGNIKPDKERSTERVRLQGFWDNLRRELTEALAHQGFHIRRLLLGEASGAV
jgi:phage terminase large subunit-like protein